jgi:hypothetical protein
MVMLVIRTYASQRCRRLTGLDTREETCGAFLEQVDGGKRQYYGLPELHTLPDPELCKAWSLTRLLSGGSKP